MPAGNSRIGVKKTLKIIPLVTTRVPFFNRPAGIQVLFAALFTGLACEGIPNCLAQTVYENYTFSTFAGPPESGPGWYDGVSNAARFNYPAGLAADSSGHVYIPDINNHTIRVISPDGEVKTLAGLAGVSGSTDGVGGFARFNQPESVAVDGNNNVYVADTGNNTVRKISPSGLVTTLAGSAGVVGTNDGVGSAARFSGPSGVAVDTATNLYIADFYNQTIRKISPAGMVTTFAGSPGSVGTNDGAGPDARFSYPSRLAINPQGDIYVSDTFNQTIRKVTSNGVVTTIAGLATYFGSADGTGTAARFNQPYGVALINGTNIYVTDTGNGTIRKITPAGVVTTIAGTAGKAGSADGGGSAASFYNPAGIAAVGTNLVIADTYNHTLRKITPSAVVTTLAGLARSVGTNSGTGAAARFNYPNHPALDTNGNLFVPDVGNHTIRKITPAGVVTTFAGLAGTSGSANGTGSNARFNNPNGATVDTAGYVYVADSGNHTIRKISPSASVSLFAGQAGTSGTNNGTGSSARFNSPANVAVDKSNNVYVADTSNHTIRKITTDGSVTTLAGSGGVSGTNDGTTVAARFNQPYGLTVDNSNNVFVADSYNHTIRKITAAGDVITLAGSPGLAGTNDGVGHAARFYFPVDVAVDSSNNLYVVEYSNHTIRKVTPGGVVTTLAGKAGFSGNIDGSGETARFNNPFGLTVSGDGTLFVADYGNHVIRRGMRALSDQPIADLPDDATGVSRQLDVMNRTTTSWHWSLVRRPANSAILPSPENQYNSTFAPDATDVYVLRFQGTNDSGNIASGILKLTGLSSPVTSDAYSTTGNEVILRGSGGTPGSTFSVLATTNLDLPLPQWMKVTGGIVDVEGHCTFTNGMTTDGTPRYFRIQMP